MLVHPWCIERSVWEPEGALKAARDGMPNVSVSSADLADVRRV